MSPFPLQVSVVKLWMDSQTNVHQLVQLRAATFIQVSAAGVALVHQVSQQLHRLGRFRITHALKLQHPRGLAVDVLGSLMQLKVRH